MFPDEPVPGLEEARRWLRREGTQIRRDARFPEGTETPYLAWRVEPDGNKPVVLPLSSGFRRVMEDAARQRQRETRLAAIQPELDALRDEQRAIRDKAVELGDSIALCKAVADRSVGDLGTLEALDGLLTAMLVAPKEEPSSGDRTEVERLRRLLDTLREQAYRDFLLDPADAFEAGLVTRRARQAAELLAMVEAEPFVAHVRTLVPTGTSSSPASTASCTTS